MGTHSKPIFYIPAIFLILLIPTVTHGGAELAGAGQDLFYPIMAFDILLIMFLIKKISPQHVTIIKNDGSDGIKIRGKFEGIHIRIGKELSVMSISKNNNAIEFVVSINGIDSIYKITEKYFTPETLKIIPEICSDLETPTSAELTEKYSNSLPTLKIHDSNKSTLISIVEKPDHNKITLFCLAIFLATNYVFKIYY